MVLDCWRPTQPVLSVLPMRMTDKKRAYYEWRRANWKSMSIITRLRHLVWEREECKKYIEEEKQREVAKWAEQNRIRSAARELQWSEADRLSKSIIPKLDELYCLSPQRFENEVASLFV